MTAGGRRDPAGLLATAVARATVHVEADLDVEGPVGSGIGRVRVRGAPGGLAVVVPDLRVARALRRWIRAAPGRAEGVLAFDALLRRTGLTVGVHVPRVAPTAHGATAQGATAHGAVAPTEVPAAGHEVARLGAGATPGMVSRLAGVGPLDLRMRGVFGALWRRTR